MSELSHYTSFQLEYSEILASLVAQSVKNLPVMQETWVQFLGQEDPLEKDMATHSSILAWRIQGQRSRQAIIDGVTRVGHDLATKPPQWNTAFIFFFLFSS